MQKKVLLAFSGGIDSCHAAKLLADSGYHVTGLTIDTIGDAAMIEEAAGKARALGIDHVTTDLRHEFEELIVRPFISEYIAGRTPSPCARCNPLIKWKVLAEAAIRDGFDNIATGHYFGITCIDGKYFVRKAEDPIKDQSYYLWGLPQKFLSRALTPMANVIKKSVISALPPEASKKESMGICFLRGEDCGSYLRRNIGDAIPPGEVIDRSGRTVGSHDGYPYYTIGQKRGLRSEINGPVIEIDPVANRLVVGEAEDLWSSTLEVSSLNAPDIGRLLSEHGVSVKIRGLGVNPEGFCRITDRGEGTLSVRLDNPAWAPAAGQPVVFYKDDLVLGGGILERYR